MNRYQWIDMPTGPGLWDAQCQRWILCPNAKGGMFIDSSKKPIISDALNAFDPDLRVASKDEAAKKLLEE